MVVCAVRYEPVSVCYSLLTGKLTGNFTIPKLLDAISVRKAPVPQRFPGKFPTKINREIISRNREFFAGIREFRVTDGKRPFLAHLFPPAADAICSHRQFKFENVTAKRFGGRT